MWFFAEGCTRHGFDTYLCLKNPLDKTEEIAITYFRGDGSVEQKRTRVDQHSRKTVCVHGDAEGAGRSPGIRGDVGICVKSINGAGIVAERPVYFASRCRTVDRIALANARRWGEVVRGQPERKCLCLTFDSAGGGDVAVSISNILEANSANATFFVTKDFPGKYPDAIRTIAQKGHEIGNHYMTHPQFTKISASRADWELSSTDAAVQQTTGFSTKHYFRFPYGDRNSALLPSRTRSGTFRFTGRWTHRTRARGEHLPGSHRMSSRGLKTAPLSSCTLRRQPSTHYRQLLTA